MNCFDCIVVGGGPAGATAARQLAAAGLRVAVIHRPCPRVRLLRETVPAFVFSLFRRELEASAFATPHEGVLSLWEKTSTKHTSFIFSPHGAGWSVDRNSFDPWLRSKAWLAGAQELRGGVHSVEKVPRGWRVFFVGEGQSLEAVIAARLVWAGGRLAKLPNGMGRTRDRVDTLIAVEAALTGAAFAADGHSALEATASGWWFCGSESGTRCAVAYFTDADSVQTAGRNKWLLRHLRRTSLVRSRCGLEVSILDLAVRSAYTSRTNMGAAYECYVVGDAVFASDPLSSSGVAFAVGSASQAAAAILGDSSAEDYNAWVDDHAEQFLKARRAFYGSVQKWPTENFWRRRGNHA